jgi:hypothetical protein
MSCKTCIQDYIVLRDGCYEGGTPTPTSCFYVEDLEGLSVENVAQIAPEKLVSATNTVIEKLKFATIIVESRLRGILQARGLQLNTTGKMYHACTPNSTTWGAAAFDRGLYVSKTWLGSPMSAIWVESVKIKPTVTGTTEIKVKDNAGNVLFTTGTITVQGGIESTVSVRKHFYEQQIIIAADGTNIGVYEYTCNETTSCKPCAGKSEYLAIQGWNGTSVSVPGFLGVCLRLDCTDKDIICQFLDRTGIGMAILYQLGAEILKEWVSPNNRLNIIKIHGTEWATTKTKDWESLSIEYLDNEIDSIMQLMMADKYCYNCTGRLRATPFLP